MWSGVACCWEGGTKLRYDMGLPTGPRYSWSFVVVQSVMVLGGREPASPAVPAAVAGVCDDLLTLFGAVPDGRFGRGREHPVAAVLVLAAAVVAGMKGYTLRVWLSLR